RLPPENEFPGGVAEKSSEGSVDFRHGRGSLPLEKGGQEGFRMIHSNKSSLTLLFQRRGPRTARRVQIHRHPLKGTLRPALAVGPSTALRTCFSRLGTTQPGNSFPGDCADRPISRLSTVSSRDRAFACMVFLFASFTLSGRAFAQADALPSWNDGAAKQAIVE